MAEQFNLQRKDIQVPKYIMEQIESGEYDDYNKKYREYYRSRLIAVAIFLVATLISIVVASIGKTGFEYGKFFGILAVAYIGSTFLILSGNPFPQKPKYSDI